MLHVALGHISVQRDHALRHVDLDVRRVDRIVQRQSFADILADAFIGASVALGTDASISAGVARGRPAASFATLRGTAVVATEVAMSGMASFVSMVAPEVAVAGVLPRAGLMTGLIGTCPEVALVGETTPVGIHAAELVARHVAFVKATHGGAPAR